MLKVKTLLKPSKIHGIGLFADQLISKGTITWKYDFGYDPSFSLKQIKKLPELNRTLMMKCGYVDFKLNKFILCSDNQRFINHSSRCANIRSTPNKDMAIR